MIVLIISSTAVGMRLSDNLKRKITLCRELLIFCDLLLLDLQYRVTPIRELLCSTLKNERIKHLSFISDDCITENTEIKSILSIRENQELSQFLYSLGKSDVPSQKKLIEGYKEYVNNSLKYYCERHKKDSRIYVSFGLFFGIVFSLLWS